jgi:hypothetical protein
MRITGWTGAATVAVVAGVCLVGSVAMSDDKKQPADPGAAGGMDPAMMAKWQEYMTLGPHHKAMEALAGNFKYVNKWRMSPDQEWVTSEGQYNGEMIMGGRYLAFDVSGPMMGETFEGMGVMGYDNSLKKHVSGWLDNMGTGLMRMEGTCDGACKTITFSGEMKDPMTGQMKKFQEIFTVKDNDTFHMKWMEPGPDGKMFEMMTIEYTRVK